MEDKEKCPKCGFTMNHKKFCPNCAYQPKKMAKFSFNSREKEDE